MTLTWFIEQLIYFQKNIFIQGWIFDEQQEIQSLGITLNKKYYPLQGQMHLPSSDVAQAYGQKAQAVRFSGQVHIENADLVLDNLQLSVSLSDNKKIHIDHFFKHSPVASDPYHKLQHRFFKKLHDLPKKSQVIELGSRARSGVTRRELMPKQVQYTGFDILKGQNVDVTGDAHQLSQYFKPNTYDAIFSMSVFEHLIMPWKVVLEMNKLLKIGGQVMITTHHTWALHETPWDFWRFSDQAWHALFNEYTGFEIVETALGEPASIVPHYVHPVVMGLENQPAYLVSAVIAKKTSETQLSWDVDASKIVQDMYPQ
ncbi:methyltransferase domain-containing protein [Candidatus Albibeggiatoa sp. nov. NOAA]|uniref:methyltransferase domain-containing protein n=1 Tax=Candidatus Albibeggiatoa sp. nov. NOAA TaxID=3162724 RepID=UPI003305072F|nr:class I SAM-dependent methyltransferase [Thiotrichaceae bacterium]